MRDKNVLIQRKENTIKNLRSRLSRSIANLEHTKLLLKRETKLRAFEKKSDKLKYDKLYQEHKICEKEMEKLIQSSIQVNESLEICSPFLKKRQCFSDKLELCVHELLDNSAAMEKVSNVIQSFLKLYDRYADRLAL